MDMSNLTQSLGGIQAASSALLLLIYGPKQGHRTVKASPPQAPPPSAPTCHCHAGSCHDWDTNALQPCPEGSKHVSPRGTVAAPAPRSWPAFLLSTSRQAKGDAKLFEVRDALGTGGFVPTLGSEMPCRAQHGVYDGHVRLCCSKPQRPAWRQPGGEVAGKHRGRQWAGGSWSSNGCAGRTAGSCSPRALPLSGTSIPGPSTPSFLLQLFPWTQSCCSSRSRVSGTKPCIPPPAMSPEQSEALGPQAGCP